MRNNGLMGRRIQVGSSLVVVTGAVAYGTAVTSWEEVTSAFATIESGHAAGLAALAIVNLVSYWLVLAAAVPGLGVARAAAIHLPANAVSNIVPAGGALGTGLTIAGFRRWGYGASHVAAATLVTGLWNNLAKLAAPLLALVALASTGGSGWSDVAVAAIAMVVMAAIVVGVAALLRSDRFAVTVAVAAQTVVSRVLGLLGRGPVMGWESAAQRFRRDTATVIRDRWVALTGATVFSHVALFTLLVASLRAVGVEASAVSWVELLGVFALARVVSLVPLSPGGVGLIEVTLATTLAAAGGDVMSMS